MGMPAENLRHEDEGNEDQDDLKSPLKDADENKDELDDLTAAERNAWKQGKLTRGQILEQKATLARAAKIRMRELSAKQILPQAENARLLKQLDELTSPEKIRMLQEHIEEIAEKGKKEGEKGKEIDPQSPALIKLERKFIALCEDSENQKYLGGNRNIAEWKMWIKKERMQHPSIKHMEDILSNFQNDANSDGLKKRQEFYHKELAPKFKKYGFASPMTSDYVKREGLSERKNFLNNVDTLEKHFQNINKDLYSQQTIRSEMRAILTAKNPDEQEQLIKEAKQCSRIENENYTYLQKATNTVTIGKYTIPAMSERSMEFLLKSHQREEIGEKRMQSAAFWPSSIKFLKGLAKELEENLKNHPDLLEKAVGIFKVLSDDAKIDFVKDYKEIGENKEKQEDVEAKAMIKSANSEINKAQRGRYICDKTAKHFKENFTEEKYKDKKTGRFDLKSLEGKFKLLTQTAPEKEKSKRNLAAYFTEHQKYLDDLEQLEELNPEMDRLKIKALRDDYEKLTWNKKEKKHTELKNQISEFKKKKDAITEIESANDIPQKAEKNEAKEGTLEWGLLLRTIASLEENGQYGEIVKILLFHYTNIVGDENSNPSDEAKIWAKLSHYRDLANDFGKGRQSEESFNREMEATIEEVAANDNEIHEDLKMQQVQRIGIDLVEQNQRKTGMTSSRDRSEEESVDNTKAGSDEEKITEQFYEDGPANDNIVLDKEGVATEVTEVKIGSANRPTGLDRQKLMEDTYEYQDEIAHGQGESSFEITDGKTGRILKGLEARTIHRQEQDKVEEKLSEESVKKMEDKTGKVLDFQERAAALRAAKQKGQEKINEQLESRS